MSIVLQLVLLIAGLLVVFIVGAIVGFAVGSAFGLSVGSFGSEVRVIQMRR